MLLTVLTFLLAQVPQSPQVLIPATRYDAELIEVLRGHEAVELCDGVATATTVELEGSRQDPYRALRASDCQSPILLVGTMPLAGEKVPTSEPALDRETGDVVVTLEGQLYRFRSTPYSDGGVRFTLVHDDGFIQTLFESPAPAATAELLWAGDLNGDGQLDLVVEASEGHTLYQQLLLSDEDGLPVLVAETVAAPKA